MPPQDTSWAEIFWRFMLSQENIRFSTAWHSLLSKTVKERSLSIPWEPFLRNSSKDFLSQGNGRPTAENYHCQEKPCTQPASPFLRDSWELCMWDSGSIL